MSELREILKEEYLKQASKLDIRTLLEMVEEVLQQPLQELDRTPMGLAEDAPSLPMGSDGDDLSGQDLEMVLKMIPDIAVSEIGWSDVKTTDEGEEIKGPQRRLLEDYLKNLRGDTFSQKIKGVEKFYTEGAELIATQVGDDRTKRIVQAISYLVFYKTLTKVITNFNAASAGFSFESFLAALVNGYQIPANTGTIADYVDRAEGQEIPVSLKLYKEGKLEVGGSYTDLVRDLVNPKYPDSIGGGMRYVVCTKDLEGSDLDQEGSINFYQFDFTLQNVMNILVRSSKSSQYCIRLPRAVVEAVATADEVSAVDLLQLPAKERRLSAEELTPLFAQELGRQIEKFKADNPKGLLANFSQEHLKALVESLNWEKNDELFNKSKARGADATLNKKRVTSHLGSIYGDTPELVAVLAPLVVNANLAVNTSQKAKAKTSQRKQMLADLIKSGGFFTPEESREAYNTFAKDPAKQKQLLLNTLGYLETYHFSLNQTQSTNSGPPTNTIHVGTIKVGKKLVAHAVGNVRDVLNEEVYEIFQSLKILSDSLNQFFAGGLENDMLAKESVDSAQNISSKDILQTK